jgi:hypothetical protein
MKFNLGEPILKKYDTDALIQLQESFSQTLQERYKLISSFKLNQHK